jgi:hypothetical protein
MNVSAHEHKLAGHHNSCMKRTEATSFENHHEVGEHPGGVRLSKRSVSPLSQSLWRAEELAARQRLERALLDFFMTEEYSNGEDRGRSPNADDLVQLFLDYAQTRLDISAPKVISAPSYSSAVALVNAVVKRIINVICAEENGIWKSAVSRACDAVEINSPDSSNEECNRDRFLRPRRGLLSARLHIHALSLLEERCRIEDERESAISSKQVSLGVTEDAEEIARQLSKRAALLRSCMKELNWSKEKLHQESKLAHKTIKRILEGQDVRPTTLETLSNCLRGKLPREISFPSI